VSWAGVVDLDCFMSGGVVCGTDGHAEEVFVCHCGVDDESG